MFHIEASFENFTDGPKTKSPHMRRRVQQALKADLTAQKAEFNFQLISCVLCTSFIARSVCMMLAGVD